MPGAPSVSLSPGDAWGFAWRVVTKRFAQVALPLGVGWFVYFVLANLVSGGGSLAVTILADQGLVDASMLAIINLATSLFGGIIGLVVAAFMMGGLVSTGLKAARGQPVSFGDSFSGGRFFGPMLVAIIGNFICLFIGMILCVVPGIILSIGLWLYPVFIVDQGLSGIDALKKSWEVSKGHKMTIFLILLIGSFVMLGGVLACGIGVILVSLPMLMIAQAWVYLRLKGEPVSEPS